MLCSTICAVCMCYALLYVRCVCATICAVCMCYALLYVRCVCAMLYYALLYVRCVCAMLYYALLYVRCVYAMLYYALLYVRCVCAMLYYSIRTMFTLLYRTTFTIIANILVFACFWILLEKINNSTDTTTHLTPADKEVFWVSSEIVCTLYTSIV